MSTTLARVIDIVAFYSGIPATKLTATSAIDQDVKIIGGDVTELVESLAEELGEQIRQWPWRRFAELNEIGISIFTLPDLVWRLVTRPIHGRVSDPSPLERLELGHIAAVIDRGARFEP